MAVATDAQREAAPIADEAIEALSQVMTETIKPRLDPLPEETRYRAKTHVLNALAQKVGEWKRINQQQANV